VFGTASVEPEDAVADVVAVGAKYVRYGYGYDYPNGRRVKVAPPWPRRSNNQSSHLPTSMRCRSAAGVGLCGLGPIFGHRRASRALPAYNPVLRCRRSVFVLTNSRDQFLLCLRHQLAHAPKYAGAVNYAPSLPRFLAGRSQLAHALTVDQAVNDARLNSAFLARLAAAVQSAVDRFAMPDLGMQPLVDPATVRGDWHARETNIACLLTGNACLLLLNPCSCGCPLCRSETITASSRSPPSSAAHPRSSRRWCRSWKPMCGRSCRPAKSCGCRLVSQRLSAAVISATNY